MRNAAHATRCFVGSILYAPWCAVITLITISYRLVAPITPIGRLFTVDIAVVRLGVVAVLIGLGAAALEPRTNRESVVAPVGHHW